jgi:uncharacterized protein
MSTTPQQAEVVIAGAGLGGLCAALELLDRGRTVLLLDKDGPENLGGLARESFGGVHLIGTPQQRRLRIKDSPELAWEDWQSYAEFEPEDDWPKAWARRYCERSREDIFDFLDGTGIRFLPVVNWPERGMQRHGNRVPRWHIAWGTGKEIIARLAAALEAHPRRRNLSLRFGHEVQGLDLEGGRVAGLRGRQMEGGAAFTVRAEHVVIASGGICGGDLSRLRSLWRKELGPPPEIILNGAHPFGDGQLHDRVAELGGRLTRLEWHWHYAAGVHHPARRKPFDGLSLVPPRSALWLNALGRRMGPPPLVSYTDTRYQVEAILREPGGYSWQLMNRRIAARELAVSGSSHMTAFVEKRRLLLLKQLLFGNQALVDRLIRECPEDFAVADTLPELVERMNARSLFGLRIDAAGMRGDVESYDAEIDRGEPFFSDEQLGRIRTARAYRGDRFRTCRYQKILDAGAGPLIAIREFILARKSLGGIQTDLGSRVLREDGSPIPGLYAVGEAAGFGGGGIHGRRALEGTFLGACVLTGRAAGRAIAEG